MDLFRLRLKFDYSVLSDSQKSDGLERSWILVEPGHRTISDLSCYLFHAFDLRDSCPYGIFLSVEGFALPYFESIAILDSTDLVCVKRKGDKKLTFPLGKPVSVNEDFEKEVGGFRSESEETDEDVQTDLLDAENVPNGHASIMKGKTSKRLKNSKCSNTNNWEGIVCLSSEPEGTVKASMSRSTRRRKTQKQRWRVAEQLRKKKSQGEGLEDEDHLKISDQKKKDVQQYPVAKESLNWCEIKNCKKRGRKRQMYDQKQASLKWNEFRATPDKQPTCKWNENRPPQMNTAPASTSENGSKDVWEEMIAATNAKRADTQKEDSWIIQKREPTNYTSENGSKNVWEELSAVESAKNADSLKEDSWNSQKRKPSNYNWSYRTNRSRALSLNMPELRAQNGHGGADGPA